MSKTSKIEWTESTWNPITGCEKVSPACINCYAERFAERFRGVEGHPYQQGFDIKLWPNRLEWPKKWKKPKKIFVNSMSDIFLECIPDDYIKDIFNVMLNVDYHIYQVLTKRAENMFRWCSKEKINIPNHIWMGVSVENQDYVKRITYLSKIIAQVKFVSFEPLLGPIELNSELLSSIDWVIIGGESGPKARPMKEEWVDLLYEQCKQYNVPFFFKQWGAYNNEGKRVGKKKSGRLYRGKEWNQMPTVHSEKT